LAGQVPFQHSLDGEWLGATELAAAVKAKLLRRLTACLETEPNNDEELRNCLEVAERVGLDWRELYAEAFQRCREHERRRNEKGIA
jgi:hypothetical protein